jgi:hypothetical protein
MRNPEITYQKLDYIYKKIYRDEMMINFKQIFVCLFFFIIATNTFARYGFDRMRCKGELIDEGYTFEKVIELCGQPLEERNWGNQYETKKWDVYKHEVSSALYYLYFEDGKLKESTMHLQ